MRLARAESGQESAVYAVHRPEWPANAARAVAVRLVMAVAIAAVCAVVITNGWLQ